MNKDKIIDAIVSEVYLEEGSLFPELVSNVDNIRNSIAWGTYFIKFMDDLYGEGGYGSPYYHLEEDKKEMKKILKDKKSKIVNLKQEKFEFASENYKKLIEDPFISYINDYQKKSEQAKEVYSDSPKYAQSLVPAYSKNIDKFFIWYFYLKAMKDNLENPLAQPFKQTLMFFISEGESIIKEWLKPELK